MNLLLLSNHLINCECSHNRFDSFLQNVIKLCDGVTLFLQFEEGKIQIVGEEDEGSLVFVAIPSDSLG